MKCIYQQSISVNLEFYFILFDDPVWWLSFRAVNQWLVHFILCQCIWVKYIHEINTIMMIILPLVKWAFSHHSRPGNFYIVDSNLHHCSGMHSWKHGARTHMIYVSCSMFSWCMALTFPKANVGWRVGWVRGSACKLTWNKPISKPVLIVSYMVFITILLYPCSFDHK